MFILNIIDDLNEKNYKIISIKNSKILYIFQNNIFLNKKKIKINLNKEILKKIKIILFFQKFFGFLFKTVLAPIFLNIITFYLRNLKFFIY